MIAVAGDRAWIFAHENARSEEEKPWVRECPKKTNGRPNNLFEVPECPPLQDGYESKRKYPTNLNPIPPALIERGCESAQKTPDG